MGLELGLRYHLCFPGSRLQAVARLRLAMGAARSGLCGANHGVHSGGRPCREAEACRTRREGEKKKTGNRGICNNHPLSMSCQTSNGRPPTSHTAIHTVGGPRRTAVLPPRPAPLQNHRQRQKHQSPHQEPLDCPRSRTQTQTQTQMTRAGGAGVGHGHGRRRGQHDG